MLQDTQETLQIFFGRIIENSINDQMMEYSYSFPYETLTEYVEDLCSVPIEKYIEYLGKNTVFGPVTAEQITQISSYANCEIEFCRALANVKRALTPEDIGALLQNDGVIRNSVANTKYGENHAKAAMQLGLAQLRYGYWYLSCLGKLFPLLDEKLHKPLLARVLLRDNHYGRLAVELSLHDVKMVDFWKPASLSESTQLRRRSSVRQLFQLLSFQAHREGFHFPYKLNFSIGSHQEITQLVPNNQIIQLDPEISSAFIPKNSFDYYVNCFAHLHTNKSGNTEAPHKYVLLIAITKLVQAGALQSTDILLDELLIGTFDAEWQRLGLSELHFVKNAKMPFDHMGSEPFWTKDKDGDRIDQDLFFYMSQKGAAQEMVQLLEKLLQRGPIVEPGTLILERSVEWTIFSEGFHILKKYHPLWKSILDLVPDRGESSKLILDIDGEKFEVSLCNVKQSNYGSDLLQIRYGEGDAVAEKMRSIFREIYEYSLEQRQSQDAGKKLPVKLPINLSSKIFVYTTNMPRCFTVKYVKGGENLRDMMYYKTCISHIPQLVSSKEYVLNIMLLLRAVLYYVSRYEGAYGTENRISLTSSWESAFLRLFTEVYPDRKTSNAFSKPFLLLDKTPFLNVIGSDHQIVTPGKHTLMSFEALCEQYEAAEIDKELMAIIKSKETRDELDRFLARLIKSAALR